MSSKKITFDRSAVESGAHYAASECLLVGLRHIKEHKTARPIGTRNWAEWESIIDELIWLLDFQSQDTVIIDTPELRARYRNAKELLGEYYFDIWC